MVKVVELAVFVEWSVVVVGLAEREAEQTRLFRRGINSSIRHKVVDLSAAFASGTL